MPPLQLNLIGGPEIHRSAFFPADGIRRSLSRDWSSGPRAFVLGCNPSNAGADVEDPTTLWWNRWFNHHGYGGYDAGNLYPFVSSSPQECKTRTDAANETKGSPDYLELAANLDAIVELASKADAIFACYGNIAWDPSWTEHALERILEERGPAHAIWCWGRTKSGAPIHPMARGKHRINPLQEPILFRRPDGRSQ
ncbi:MAG: hypothetical protein CL949_20560 [Erythrobacter sp.]|nr:hypothetical protein [Erythrobacter sp.]